MISHSIHLADVTDKLPRVFALRDDERLIHSHLSLTANNTGGLIFVAWRLEIELTNDNASPVQVDKPDSLHYGYTVHPQVPAVSPP